MELKKSYKGFFIWMVAFCAGMLVLGLLPIQDTALLIRVILNGMVLGIVLLAFIIYKTGYIYWYNGITYENACEAGEERRNAYARKHFKHFLVAEIILLVYSCLAQVLCVSYWVDTVVFTVGIVVAAITTMRYKL